MIHLAGDFLDGRGRTLFIVAHLVARCACLSDQHACIDPSGVIEPGFPMLCERLH